MYGIVNNGVEAQKTIEEKQPDILLLDLDLPQMKGNELLKFLSNKNILVILITGNAELLNEINIFDFSIIRQIYIKPFEFEKLNEDIQSIILEEYSYNLKNNIKYELNMFNFNKTSNGYKYLVECLEYCYNEPLLLKNMEKELFGKVADENNLNNTNIVKWSIHKAIVSMERYTDSNIILKYFPYTKNPTSKVFILRIEEILRYKHKGMKGGRCNENK